MNITKFCLDGQTGHDLFWMEGEIESAILSNEADEPLVNSKEVMLVR